MDMRINKISWIAIIAIIGCLILSSHCFRVKPDVLTLQSAATINQTNILFPLPKSIKITAPEQAAFIYTTPCQINYKIIGTPATDIQRMVNHYLINVFKCEQTKPGNTSLLITVKDTTQLIAQTVLQEKYQLTIRNSTTWDLIADTHVGFLRGFQTFSQLFQPTQLSPKGYVINGIPILIIDQPNYVWRGVMLDTSRHYYPVKSILHFIDALMYNKMGIFHWHMIDEDSFPIEIAKRPELSGSGKIGGVYTLEDVLTIISYAKVRGVRVIPEFDTPAHTQSWGRSQTLKQITVDCDKKYEGQFDPTLDLTYQVLHDVMQYVNATFQDSYAHFGGDQIEQYCWQNKPSISKWMETHGIKTYYQLQQYYRQQQKKLWREKISEKKKAIYWANEKINLPVESDDVIQWWGDSKNVGALVGKKNQIILSNYDLAYLDLGFGGRGGVGYGIFITWRQMYAFEPRIKDVNVIGGQTCMWSEICDENTLDQKIWIRSSAFAERLWNVDVDINVSLLNISQRLVSQSKRMKIRGFKVSPVTVGLCQKDPTICFK